MLGSARYRTFDKYAAKKVTHFRYSLRIVDAKNKAYDNRIFVKVPIKIEPED